MNKPNINKETGDVLSKGQKIANFVNSDDWIMIKGTLLTKLIDFDSIKSIELDKKTPTELGEEIRTRKAVVDVVLDWIKDIEGSADQYKKNAEALYNNNDENGIIQRFG